jgi:hypothetical protein
MKRGAPDHPKMLMLEAELIIIGQAVGDETLMQTPKVMAVGLIELLINWTAKYAISGDVGKWPNYVIAKGLGWKHDSDMLIKALIDSRWLDEVEGPRLVLHDIQDHADNAWRQALEDSGLTWWDGSDPRKYKIQASRKTQEKLQKNTSKTPQSKPESESKPLLVSIPPRETDDAADAATTTTETGEEASPQEEPEAESELLFVTESPEDQAKVVIGIWNRMKPEKCPAAPRLTQTRAKLYAGLLRRFVPWQLEALIARIDASKFLTGRKRGKQGDKAFLASLDWLAGKDTAERLQAGEFDDYPDAPPVEHNGNGKGKGKGKKAVFESAGNYHAPQGDAPALTPVTPEEAAIGDAVWIDIQSDLREQFDAESFETWIAPLTCRGITEDAIVLAAPSLFLRNWVAQTYCRAIEDAAQLVLGRNVRLVLDVIEPAEEPSEEASGV